MDQKLFERKLFEPSFVYRVASRKLNNIHRKASEMEFLASKGAGTVESNDYHRNE